MRRHHNTDGRRRTQRGKRKAEVAHMARRLGLKQLDPAEAAALVEGLNDIQAGRIVPLPDLPIKEPAMSADEGSLRAELDRLQRWIEQLKTDGHMVWSLMLRGDIVRPVALIERTEEEATVVHLRAALAQKEREVAELLVALRPIERSAAFERERSAKAPSSHQEFIREADENWSRYETAKRRLSPPPAKETPHEPV